MRVVFLHGLGQSKNDWEKVTMYMNSNKVTCLPLFSHIEQDETVRMKSITDFVFNELELIDEPFVLCGLSLGGLLALDYACYQEQSNLKGLIVSGAIYKAPPKWLVTLQKFGMSFMPPSAFNKIGLTKEQLVSFVSSLDEINLTTDLPHITLPTLVMCGEKDRMNLNAAKEIQEFVPSATLTIVPKGGHELNIEQPEAFAQAINDFIMRVY